MERVELRHAYAFDCPACGRENFLRTPMLDRPGEIAELLTELELPDGFDGYLMLQPRRVTCQFCSAASRVVDDIGEHLDELQDDTDADDL